MMKKAEQKIKIKDGDTCKVVAGTVRDIKTSKTGHITITVVQKDGERFKTLARNVIVKSS